MRVQGAITNDSTISKQKQKKNDQNKSSKRLALRIERRNVSCKTFCSVIFGSSILEPDSKTF